MAGITVRALHHYDSVGLVRASHRTRGGYRAYDENDAERLTQVLAYRELGFGLEEIRTILDDPGTDPSQHLRRQRSLLQTRLDRLGRILAAIDTRLAEHSMGTTGLTPAEKLEVFGDFDPDEHAEEVQRRWGDTDAYRQSGARAKAHTKADWAEIKAEGDAIMAAFAAAKSAGLPASSAEGMNAAERARQQIDERFYDCSYEMHRNLGQMYVEDERFTATYEAIATGLAAYVRDAINANADRAEA